VYLFQNNFAFISGCIVNKRDEIVLYLSMTEESLQIIDGISVPISYDVETFCSALNYKSRPCDIFLCVYPKSGTTWVQVISYTLMHNGEAFDDDISEYFASTPFIDEIGEQGINNMHRPYVIQTHLSFNRILCDQKAKYVCVIRNPKDVCVSYYYFPMKIFDEEPSKTSFDTSFEKFINGNTYYGDYFEYLKAIWQYKDNTNVIVMSYEEMKHDLCAVIRRLARTFPKY
jgi:hypothetical protein